MDLGKTLKKLRIEKGLTQEELGKIIGVQKSAIHKYESGIVENMKRSTIDKLARFFDVSPSYLLGYSNNDVPNNIYPVDNIISFEVLGSVRAGYGGVIDEITTGEIIELPLSMIPSGQKDDYFVLQVTGNSMFPRLLDGDKILCKRTASVDSGTLAVIIYNGDDATVKRVNYVIGEDWLELVPFNPEYETRRIEGRDLEQCRVIGKVVKLIRDL